MFFLLSFIWLVAASFAFVLAILRPTWLTLTVSTWNINNRLFVQRGIFDVCDGTLTNGIYQLNLCTSILEQKSSTDSRKWIYEYAVASASLAIVCAVLSIITIGLSGVYFHFRRQTKDTLILLLFLIGLVLIICSTSFVVWILLIAETSRLGYRIDRQLFAWPMWLAVGATGGYLISLVIMLISFFAKLRQKKLMERNYFYSRNQF